MTNINKNNPTAIVGIMNQNTFDAIVNIRSVWDRFKPGDERTTLVSKRSAFSYTLYNITGKLPCSRQNKTQINSGRKRSANNYVFL